MERLVEFLQFLAGEGGFPMAAGIVRGGGGAGERQRLTTQLRQVIYIRTSKVTSTLPLKLEQAIDDEVWLLVELDGWLPFALTRGLSRLLLKPQIPTRVLFYDPDRGFGSQLATEVWRPFMGAEFQFNVEEGNEPFGISII